MNFPCPAGFGTNSNTGFGTPSSTPLFGSNNQQQSTSAFGAGGKRNPFTEFLRASNRFLILLPKHMNERITRLCQANTSSHYSSICLCRKTIIGLYYTLDFVAVSLI